jgi:integrase
MIAAAPSPSEPVLGRRPLPFAQWPVADRTAWTAALMPGDPFEPGGLADGWAANTRRGVQESYGLWLRWLDQQLLLEPDSLPASRITRKRAAAYAAALRSTRSPYSVQSRIQQLGDALRVMAPDQAWTWIGRAAGRLRSRATTVRNKRDRLQSPERLAELGRQLMSEAVAIGLTLDAAVLHRNGLSIALLAYRPLRMRNLAMIRCDRHLVYRNGAWWLLFAGDETKGKRPLESPFPGDLIAHLARYLETYRPILLTAGGQHAPAPITELWVSRDATALCYSTIAHHIKRHTRAAFGAPVNPHLFRDCAATSIAIVDPVHVRIIAAILGHSTMDTSERYYNQARGLEAGRRYQDTIGAIRKDSGKRAAARPNTLPALHRQRRDGPDYPIADPFPEA